MARSFQGLTTKSASCYHHHSICQLLSSTIIKHNSKHINFIINDHQTSLQQSSKCQTQLSAILLRNLITKQQHARLRKIQLLSIILSLSKPVKVTKSVRYYAVVDGEPLNRKALASAIAVHLKLVANIA